MKGNIVKTKGGESPLKLLKTITLEEDVTAINVTFDKPLREFAVLFEGAFTDAVNASIGAYTNSGLWYAFNRSLTLRTDKNYFYAHVTELSERNWEAIYQDGLCNSIGGSSSTGARYVYSQRADNLSRYIKDLRIIVQGGQASFVSGAKFTIWGVEVDEQGL